MKKEAIRVSTMVPTAPTTLYLAWLNAEQHSAMTGGVAKIDPQVGGGFTTWNGYISGKLVILDLGRRLVMSWRTTDFPREAPDSRVEVHFEALGGSTRLTILHTEIPEGQSEQYRELWNEKYFGPMRTFFSKYLPDPRKPPPPRPPPPPIEEEEEEEVVEETTAKKAKLAAKPPPPSKKELVKPPPPSKKVLAKPPPPSKKALAKPPPSKGKLVTKAPPAKSVAKAPTAKAKPTPAKKPAAKKPAPAKKPAAKKPAPAKKPAAKKPAAKTKAKKKKK